MKLWGFYLNKNSDCGIIYLMVGSILANYFRKVGKLSGKK